MEPEIDVEINVENEDLQVKITRIELHGEYLHFYGEVKDKSDKKKYDFDDYTDLSDFMWGDDENCGEDDTGEE